MYKDGLKVGVRKKIPNMKQTQTSKSVVEINYIFPFDVGRLVLPKVTLGNILFHAHM